MARAAKTKTNLENLAIRPQTRHGDVREDTVFAVYPLDSGLPSTAVPNLLLTDSGRMRCAYSDMSDDFYGVTTTSIEGRTSGFTGTAPGTADTVTLVTTAGVGGAAKILGGTTDNDATWLHSTEVSFYGMFSPSFETRLYLDSAAAVGLMIGFQDATGLAANASSMTLINAAWVTNCVEGAEFVYDTDATTDTIRCMAVKTNVDATNVDTALVPVAAIFNTYRVDLVDDGTLTAAKFYIDGVLVGTIADALLRTTALAPFICIGCRTGAAAKYAIVDYVKVWQNRV